MPLKLVQICAPDVTGAGSEAIVQIIDRDRLRRETGPSYLMPVRLTAAERTMLQGIRDRGIAKLQGRLDRANADVTADPNAPVDLTVPIAGETP